jgi:hypothetical protein
MAMTRTQLSSIVSKITYRNWDFRIHDKGDGFLIQAVWMAPDANTGKMELQKGRKWYVSSHACEGEIIRTIYKIVEAAEIHEMQEHFKYCGQKIFNPHLHPEDLALLIAGGWIGLSVRGQQTAPMEYQEAARKALLETARLVTKQGNKPKKVRNYPTDAAKTPRNRETKCQRKTPDSMSSTKRSAPK